MESKWHWPTNILNISFLQLLYNVNALFSQNNIVRLFFHYTLCISNSALSYFKWGVFHDLVSVWCHNGYLGVTKVAALVMTYECLLTMAESGLYICKYTPESTNINLTMYNDRMGNDTMVYSHIGITCNVMTYTWILLSITAINVDKY